ncbi:DNA mismatch repair protein MutT [Curtobacterium oceanosedimentum]|uniref:DNA mismatch repair protein MutT n=1 Tax=Curtobacterium oceanosedimentum TaxID=465820 RepID=A0A147DUJ0_9MICO|nr:MULTISPECIES: NUDIX domain-containing protein [Curtobacterium]KTR41098.1 DNA mismatch repair protein MutT [Curtobacterium oceanosedimentum]KTR53840.1 DNA mismatch repair protein MutT [Curtobacterium oceanosedimentum]QCR42192.1 NUDIX domain-containing protein [Curtobacterium sp. SGAir0471]
MEYTDYDTRLAAYGVITEGDRVLLARLRIPEAGTWTLPGGGVEFDETVEQAVVREVREETGYEASCGPLLGIRHHIVPKERRMHDTGRPMKAVQVVFRVTLTGGELRNETDGSTDEAAWVPIAELPHRRHGLLVPIALEWARRP